MRKAIVISIVVIISIIIGNILTQNYTKQSITLISADLKELRQDLLKEDVNWESAKQNIEKIQQKWLQKYKKMAFYIEHDELEKVEDNLTGLKSYIDTQEVAEAVSELDKSVFVLKHIEEKNVVNLKNIF